MLFWNGRASSRVRGHPNARRGSKFAVHSTGAGRPGPTEAVMLRKKEGSHEGNEFESTGNEEIENYGDEEEGDDEDLFDDEDLEEDEEFEDEDSDFDEDFEDEGYEDDDEELDEFEEGDEER